MPDLVRTVRSGSVGLDLVLGGGPRLLHRVARSRQESATMLVRGGPGAGKSVLATDIALRMAKALGGDVLYTCVEVLPREVIAQRMGFEGYDPAATIDLAEAGVTKREGVTSAFVVGMTEMEPGPAEDGAVPDLGRMILDLGRFSIERGCTTRVVVVDSLSDGYGLGMGVPRPIVDGVCKLAIEQGWVLILVEEAVDDRASPWSFAVDTVLSLAVTPAGKREVRVTKHRFGRCQPGPHRLLIESAGVRVVPSFEAYRDAVTDLELPAPAKGRSLRVPVVGTEPDWESFAVPDGKGRVVVVTYGVEAGSNPFDELTARVGTGTQDGVAHSEARGTLSLAEAHDTPWAPVDTGFLVGTLHQMMDGEEWLEAAFSYLNSVKGPLVRVRIGPTEILRVYEHAETLRKAISLLVTILSRRGLLVVLCGADAPAVVRAVVVGEYWHLGPIEQSPVRRVTVERKSLSQTTTFDAALP